MISTLKNIKILYFLIVILLAVGALPLLTTGWLLSERSAKELRAVEGRYQTQLVQDKARQLEMLGKHYGDLVESFAYGFELSPDLSILSTTRTQEKLGTALEENPDLAGLYIKPVSGEPLLVYRPELITKTEIEVISDRLIPSLKNKRAFFDKPQKLQSAPMPVMAIGIPLVSNQIPTASVVAIVSLQGISRVLSESKAAGERELWHGGLPITFVVNENGQAVFHPDSQVVASQKDLSDLKIVEEWKTANRQIQSATMPFEANFENKNYEMLGAYSTANIGENLSFGVIAMQDENRALASVGEMRRQTWLLSIGLAIAALIFGSLLTARLTKPVNTLVQAANRIAMGDLTSRIGASEIRELDTLGTTFNLMSQSLEEHIAGLAKAAQENHELFVGTVKALAAAIDGKDRYTRGHSERVSRISVAIGRRVGMPASELETLRISALLHDVGKIAIDDSILKKPSALSDEEFEIMKTHPQKGYKIMSQIPAMKDFLPGMYMHHEMVDGKGYPQGLKGDEIPLQAKIISVADTFDAMTTDRPYQKGMSLPAAVARIETFVGTRYDEAVVNALKQAYAAGEIRAVGVHPNQVNQKAEEDFDFTFHTTKSSNLSASI